MKPIENVKTLLVIRNNLVAKNKQNEKETLKINRFAETTYKIGSNGLFLTDQKSGHSKVYSKRTTTIKGTPLHLLDKKKLNEAIKHNWWEL